MRNVLLSLVLLLLPATVLGQRNASLFRGGQSMQRKVYNASERRQTVKVPPAPRVVHVKGKADAKHRPVEPIAPRPAVQDTVRCISLTRRHGWSYAVGRRLSTEEASHLPFSYRLTERDSLGHFLHIEAVDGYGRLTPHHDRQTYFVNNGDSTENREWTSLLRTVVQWDITPSADGRFPALEKGYDWDGNLIYVYVTTLFNDSTVIGHYTDAFGEPRCLRSGIDEAVCVQIGLDRQGREHTVRYINADTHNCLNGDGSYILRMDYDSLGNITRKTSCAQNGVPMMDGWGNCAFVATYNGMGQIVSKKYLDDDGLPMRTPNRRKGATDVMERHYEYDSQMRLVAEYFMTDSCTRDLTSDGIWRRTWEYDSRGQLLCRSTLDSLGRLRAEADGIAQRTYTYSPQGALLSKTFKDDSGRLVNNQDETSPTEEQRTNYETTYTEKGPLLVMERIEQRTGETLRVVTTTDREKHLRVEQTFRNGELVGTFGQTLAEDNETPTGQYGYDALGHQARSHLEDALYYRVERGKTYHGTTAYLVGRNEYGEPSYVQEGSSPAAPFYCTKLFDENDKATYLDEHNEEIADAEAGKSQLNKAFCIEVTGQKAYELGLRSGDLIVGYGDFRYPVAETSPRHSWLQLEIYLTRKKAKEVLLLRFDPNLGRHKMVSLRLPEGRQDEMGFLIHSILLTTAESARYNGQVEAYLAQQGIEASAFTTEWSRHGSRRVPLIRPYSINAEDADWWQHGLRDDAVLLAVETLNKHRGFISASLSEGYGAIGKVWDEGGDSTTYVFTLDGETVRTVTCKGGVGVLLDWDFVPDHEAQLLQRLEAKYLFADTPMLTDTTMLSASQAIALIDSHTTEHVRLRTLTPADDLFQKLLNRSKQQDALGQAISGVDEVVSMFADSAATGKDNAVRKYILQRLDTSAYEMKEVGYRIFYLKRSEEDASRFSEIVLVFPDEDLCLYKGNIEFDPTQLNRKEQ